MEKAPRGVAPDLSLGPLTQAEPLDAARVEFADAAQQSRRLQFCPQVKQSAGKQRNRADRQRVFGAAINREAARRGRRPALKLYSQLAQNPDRRAAGVERMRAEVEMETLLHVRPCPPASGARFLEQHHIKPGASQKVCGGKPRQSSADNSYIRFDHFLCHHPISSEKSPRSDEFIRHVTIT